MGKSNSTTPPNVFPNPSKSTSLPTSSTSLRPYRFTSVSESGTSTPADEESRVTTTRLASAPMAMSSNTRRMAHCSTTLIVITL